ncbi:hypothetical protein D3C81_443380 [compost metagenome]
MSYNDPTGQFVPILVGIALGAGTDLGIQLALNGGDFQCVSWTQVGVSGALGILGGNIGSKGLPYVMKNYVSKKMKGDIGEGVARIGILLRGEKVLGKQDAAIEFVTEFGNLSKKAGRAVPDYIVQKNGVIKVVEAKFGTAQLTPAQRALRKEIGSDRFYISRTTYQEVANVGRGVGATTGGGGVGSTLDIGE